MKIIYGTSNKNKVIAMKKILKDNDINAEIYTLRDIGFSEKIIEDGKIKKSLVTDLWLEKYDLIKFSERYIEVFYEKE